MSVGESDAGILASDFCDALTDTTMFVDNWQPLLAAKQRETDTLTCCWHRLVWGYRGGSPTAVQAWQPCPLWELSPSHPHIIVD